MASSSKEIKLVYQTALTFAKNHYENFPVISILIPKHLQKHIAIIYWFARTADDFADEGNASEEDRLIKLNQFEYRLTQLLNGKAENNFEIALKNTIDEMNLSKANFYNLLNAFKQDVIKKRYKNCFELLDYCSRSANPIGRLILELFNIRDENAFNYSDKICTALQLTNFYQDVKIDWQKGRIYLPADELEKNNVDEKVFELKKNNLKFKSVLKANVKRTEILFNEGKRLLNFLSGRLKLEIKWTILSGEAILNKIKKIDYDVLNNRPELSKREKIFLLFKSFI